MKKSELREKYLKLRKTLSKDEVLLFSGNIFKNFVSTFNPAENQKVHIFQSIEKFNEVDTSIFINYFFENKIRVFVPKMAGKNLISVEIFPNSKFEKNKWGILEPIENKDSGETNFDFVITPLLYCDSEGNRVGYGKGFYDRFFSEINPDCKKIGVNFFPPKEKIDNIFAEDIPLDYLVLPDEVLSFTAL